MDSPPSVDETVSVAGARGRERVLEVGDSVGRFVILERVGAGGMGVVYAAYDPELDRKLAIKLLHVDAGGSTATAGRGRLHREARAMAGLQHPNVIAVHDVGEHEGQVFVAMEFIEGVTLGTWLEAQSPSRSEILSVFRRAGAGLAAAHDAGLVHRDFKPDNVMIGDDGRVRVLDFGLARRHQSTGRGASADASIAAAVVGSIAVEDSLAEELELTRAGAVLGTPAFMSPEQHAGEEVDARSDQFSFCVALYSALFGVRPFEGETIPELAFSVSEGRLRKPPSTSRVPAWLRVIVERGLARDPGARWPDMPGLLRALERDPGRLRRRVAVGLALVVLGGSAVGIQSQRAERAEQACRDVGPNALAQVWSDETRAQIRSALVGTEAAYADVAAQRTSEWLDRHAEAWADARSDHCRSEENLQELAAPARACLDDSLAALDELVGTLRDDPESTLPAAIMAAADLPAPGRCRDRTWLVRHGDELGADQANAELRRSIARARALNAVARHAEAVEAGRAVVEQAKADDVPLLLPAAQFELGAALQRDGEPEPAVEVLTEAFVGALEIDDEITAVRAGGLLAYALGYELRKPEHASAWRDVSGAVLRRAGLDDGLPGASWRQSIAAVAYASADYEAALADYRRAAEIRTALLGVDHPVTLASRSAVGNALSVLGNLEEARDVVLAVTEELRKQFGPDHPRLHHDLATLARVFERLGDAKAASEHASRALQIARATWGDEHLRTATAMVNYANTVDDLDERASLYRTALPTLEAKYGADNPVIGGVLNNLAIVLRQRDSLDESLRMYERALDIQRKNAGADHPATANTLINYGEAKLAAGDFPGAIEALQSGMNTMRDAVGADHPDTLKAGALLGEALWESAPDRRDEARALVQAAARAEGAAHSERAQRWLDAHAG